MMNLLNFFRRRRPADPLGRRGEQRGQAYVRHELGFKILATNVRAAGAEIDIVAVDRNDLVFIEVRTRSTDAFGPPEKTIRRDKRRFVIRAAQAYMRSHRLEAFTPRFDTLAILWPATGEPEIRYQRNAFRPGRDRRRPRRS